MNGIREYQDVALALLDYFREFAGLTVPAGRFSLDGLLPEGESMSLQITGGQTIRRYIDGSRKEAMNFTIFYRGEVAQDDAAKSAMLGILNGIGAWLEEEKAGDNWPPYLGERFEVSALEQIQTANIAGQSDAPTLRTITYQAGFVLGYSTK